MNKFVSIILPNYNHAPYLVERLKSILNQSYQNFELIVLDDASTDNSLEILDAYHDHPKISQCIVNKINTGSPFLQWAKGLALAKGEIIWIAESDDYCDFNFLESQLKILEDPEVMVSVCKTMLVDEKGESIKEVNHHLFSNNRLVEKIEAENILKIPILNVSCICFKKAALEPSSFFSQFKIIGDRVFYQEHFLNKTVVMNTDSLSYFRRSINAVSNFESKSIQHKKLFFKENLKFISYEFRLKHIGKNLFNMYLTKFFRKVKNRTAKKEKLSLTYLSIYIKYRYALK